MKSIITFVIAIIFGGINTEFFAQISLSTPNHSLEISGTISTYYNQRILKPGEEDHKKDRFSLRDAQIQIEGRYKNIFEYELQVDFADMAGASAGTIDPENPGLMDAYVVYKGIPYLNVKLGYGKTPYSRSSNVAFINSPYWQRPELTRGNLFSRRDAGLTLSSTFWKQRVNLFAGMYTGMGELALRGDNDASGKPEFIGRAEVAFPARYRYQDIDTRITPTPMVVIAANGRYVNKRLPLGESFPVGSQGDYFMKVIDGNKTTYGADVSFQYMGFSAQFEIHQMMMEPQSENSPLFQGTSRDFNKGLVRAGGYYITLNYFVKKISTIVSARYESMNINDLVAGKQDQFSAAIAYQFKGFDAMIKAQYFHILSEEIAIDPLKWTDQFRIGFQYAFK